MTAPGNLAWHTDRHGTSKAEAWILDGETKHTFIRAEGLTPRRLRILAAWCLKAADWLEGKG
jgi:hypothetical protein